MRRIQTALLGALVAAAVGCVRAQPPGTCPDASVPDIRDGGTIANDGARGVAPPANRLVPPPPGEAERVFGALFPRRLRSQRECPKGRDPKSWVDLDRWQRSDLDEGRFVPVVVERGVGEYTRFLPALHSERERGGSVEPEGEVRYVIRLETCQTNSAVVLLEAVFPAAELGLVDLPEELRHSRPRPTFVREAWTTTKL